MSSPGRVTEIIESASGDKPSEDFAGYRHVGSYLHLWVIDGATAVAETPPVMSREMTDPAWFSRALSVAIHREVGHGPLTRARLARALRPLHDSFARKAPRDLDLSAWPQAAMIYLCVSRAPRGLLFEGLSYQDCFFDLQPARARRPVPPSTRAPALPEASALKADLVGGRESMREVRRAMLSGTRGSPVTIFLDSAARGQTLRFTRRGPQVLHLGSDGFARFWEEYALETQQGEMRRTLRRGALSELCRLRNWEIAHADHGRAPKAVDDVTLMRVDLDPRGMPPAQLGTRRRDRTRHRHLSRAR